jgi:tRNA threonylcarbamoyladenosine biosynthesis protein TsaB
MAYGANQYNAGGMLLCPMIDARRMEVYTALFDKELNYLQETSALIIEDNSFIEKLEHNKICFFGDGAFKMKTIAGNNNNAVVLDGIYPTAKNIGFIAFERFRQSKFEDVAYFEPYYLKDFVSTSK